MKALTWNIGKVKITQIVEIEAGTVIQETIPNATRDNIAKIPWLVPHFADEQGNLKALVQAFVIETSDHRILVDTCVGKGKKRTDIPSWGNLQIDFLTRLEASGYKLNSIDRVLCTHLHFDHVGWNTTFMKGKWTPTFPSARYLFAEHEFAYWKELPEKEIEDDRAGIRDSVLPVFEAGLVDLVPINYSLSPEISLIPTPGHTPAHVSILIQSEGKQAVITGDAVHHPCQMAHPEWETLADTDKDQARSNRQALFERFADTEALVIGSHFASPTAGRLYRDKSNYKFIVKDV